MSNLITSSGIIRNRELPRVGVVDLGSLQDWFFDDYIFNDGVNLSWESAIKELTETLTGQGKSEDEIDSEIEDLNMSWESCDDLYLVGDWIKNDSGQYEIDQNGKHGFAATFSGYNQTLCVEYSNVTKLCHHTSPCYVMADGTGPCGNLDQEGDSVLAYSLRDEFFRKDNE